MEVALRLERMSTLGELRMAPSERLYNYPRRDRSQGYLLLLKPTPAGFCR